MFPIIPHTLLFQCGDSRRQLYIEQFIRGLSYDLNIKEAALTKKDHPTLKKTEESLSFGLQYLAKVMQDHIAVVRECLLTAFSLTPTEQLLSELKEVAQISGFVEESGSAKVDDVTMDDRSDKTKTERNFQALDFDGEIDNFISSLKNGNYMRTSYSGRLKDKKKNRNLDALLSIQGKLRNSIGYFISPLILSNMHPTLRRLVALLTRKCIF